MFTLDEVVMMTRHLSKVFINADDDAGVVMLCRFNSNGVICFLTIHNDCTPTIYQVFSDVRKMLRFRCCSIPFVWRSRCNLFAEVVRAG